MRTDWHEFSTFGPKGEWPSVAAKRHDEAFVDVHKRISRAMEWIEELEASYKELEAVVKSLVWQMEDRTRNSELYK